MKDFIRQVSDAERDRRLSRKAVGGQAAAAMDKKSAVGRAAVSISAPSNDAAASATRATAVKGGSSAQAVAEREQQREASVPHLRSLCLPRVFFEEWVGRP